AGCKKLPAPKPWNGGGPTAPWTTTPIPWFLRCDIAQKKASGWLASIQSHDGAWRSHVYGTFKDGTALTPLALHALLLPDPKNQAIPIAPTYLSQMAQSPGTLQHP